MPISDEHLTKLFSEQHSHAVYIVQFTDGTSDEIMDCGISRDRDALPPS